MNKYNRIIEIFLREFNRFAQKSFEILLENIEFSKEEQLYHYTSLISLQRIIESESLKATSIYMLNDPNELFHGREQIINWYIKNGAEKRLNLEREFAYVGFPAFVFSLTELEDDMHFWDKYGDKHKGIRIGFTPKNLIEFWRKLNTVEVILVPVVYQDYSKKYIGDYANVFNEFKKKISNEINSIISNRDLTDIDINEMNYINWRFRLFGGKQINMLYSLYE